ncbi:MAG: Hsp20/alpha crystallin family protein [Myxococcota bacterium]
MQNQITPRGFQQTGETPGRQVVAPRCDIWESEQDIVLTADVPGVQEDAVRLTLERDELLLEANTDLPQAEGEPLALEFGNVQYRRTFLVPKGIDGDAISAELRNGVLRVRLPKTAQAQPRKINIQSIQ